jgi:hypothetical protein
VKLGAVTAAALSAVVLAPAAAAHGGGGGAKGYHSTVVRLNPASPAIHIRVVDSDDRLQLRVDGNHTVVIDGYQGEPYLRFSSQGVDRNSHSPATYLNDDRYGRVALPTTADPNAPPEWQHVAPANRLYEWHDHRIHWMSPKYPAKIEAAKDEPHHIFDWTVPGTIDNKPLAIHGSLDYKPLPGQHFPMILILPLALAAIGGGVLILRNRRRKH